MFFLNFDTLFFLLLCDKLAGTLGCMRREPTENLIHLDLEMERTLKRILRDRREVARMEQLPLGPMEETRDNDVGSTRGGSIHPYAENMDNFLPPIRAYGRPSAVTPPVIRRPAIQANNFELKSTPSSYCKESSSTGSHMRTRMLISLTFWKCVIQ